MSTSVAMAAVGLGSYLFRVMPLLLMGRRTVPARVERTLRQGSAAALMALAVGLGVRAMRRR